MTEFSFLGGLCFLFIMGDFVVGGATHHDSSETSAMVRKKSQIKEDFFS